eukprot:364965-Chlamydomonas_euryale.AAC.34
MASKVPRLLVLGGASTGWQRMPIGSVCSVDEVHAALAKELQQDVSILLRKVRRSRLEKGSGLGLEDAQLEKGSGLKRGDAWLEQSSGLRLEDGGVRRAGVEVR